MVELTGKKRIHCTIYNEIKIYFYVMVSRDTRETPFKMLQKKTGDFSHFEKVKSRTCLKVR